MGFFTSIGDAFPGKAARFAAIAGLAFYLASAVWSALFIVALPQDPDWCKDAMEFEGCVEFKNTFEKLKYDHNREMVDRNSYWV